MTSYFLNPCGVIVVLLAVFKCHIYCTLNYTELLGTEVNHAYESNHFMQDICFYFRSHLSTICVKNFTLSQTMFLQTANYRTISFDSFSFYLRIFLSVVNKLDSLTFYTAYIAISRRFACADTANDKSCAKCFDFSGVTKHRNGMSRNDTGSFQYHSVFISVLSYPNLIPDSFWSIPVSFRFIPGHSASFRSVPFLCLVTPLISV